MKHLNRLLVLVTTLTVLVPLSTGAALLGMIYAPSNDARMLQSEIRELREERDELKVSLDGMIRSLGNVRDWPTTLIDTARASAGAGLVHGAALEQIRVRMLDRFTADSDPGAN